MEQNSAMIAFAKMDGRMDTRGTGGSWGGNLGLTLRWMLETAVGDGAEKLWLQQKIPETSRVDADIAALFVRVTARDSQVALLCRGSVGSCWRRRCCIVCL